MGFTQHYAHKWYFGINAGLDFSSGVPVAITNGALSTSEGCSSISDAGGNILFYTNGITVWNKQNQIMTNGTGLYGGLSSTHSALIVPLPGNHEQYYIFTTPEIGGVEGFRYSIVDMSLQNGLGEVIVKNELILLNVTEKIAAELHANGTDYWVVTHEWGTNSFYSYLLTAAGLNQTPVVSSVGIVHNTSVIQNTYGQMKFSTCDDKLAAAISYQDTVEIFRFDPSTGEVHSPITLPMYDHIYGLEFSPDGNLLYIGTYVTSESLVQFDISSGDAATILTSKQVISGLEGLYGLQLGPDAKIYVARGWIGYLGVINDPNVAGINCDFDELGVALDPNYQFITSSLGLPGFMQSFFRGKNTCFATGTHGVDVGQNRVYPNPSISEFTLSGSNSYLTQGFISDLQGKTLQTFALPAEAELHFGSELDAGVYFLILSSEQERTVVKLIKE